MRFVPSLLVGLVLSGALTAALSPETDGHPLPTPRGPISIDGNDEFTPANGVRSGTGEEGDPYVISNWLIVAMPTHAISIRNTDRHVVVSDNRLAGVRGDPTAVYISNARNVSVEGNQISAAAEGIVALQGSDVVIRGNDIKGRQSRGVGSGVWLSVGGITVAEGRALVEGNDVSNFYKGIGAGLRSTHVIIRNNDIHDVVQGVAVTADRPGIEILYNRIWNATNGILVAGSNGTDIIGNDLRQLTRAFHIYGTPTRDNMALTAIGNKVSGATGQSRVFDCHECRFSFNLFERMGEGLGVAGPVDVSNNAFRSNGVAIGTNTDDQAVIRYNTFSLDNRILAIASHGETIDLRYNWWGTPAGPDAERLVRDGGDFLLAPWLREPPAH